MVTTHCVKQRTYVGGCAVARMLALEKNRPHPLIRKQKMRYSTPANIGELFCAMTVYHIYGSGCTIFYSISSRKFISHKHDFSGKTCAISIQRMVDCVVSGVSSYVWNAIELKNEVLEMKCTIPSRLLAGGPIFVDSPPLGGDQSYRFKCNS